MCVVSNVMGGFGEDNQDYIKKFPLDHSPNPYPDITWSSISRAEFEELKRRVEQLERDLIAAKKQDEEEGNPDCEHQDKIDFIKNLCKHFGLDIEEVLKR